DDQERDADRDGQGPEGVQDGVTAGRGEELLEVGEGPPEREQNEQRQEQQDGVDEQLPPRRELAGEGVGVGVAREQDGLEEQHARVRDLGGPAEPRQDQLADDGLDQEEQKRADEQGGGEERQSQGTTSRASAARMRRVHTGQRARRQVHGTSVEAHGRSPW